MNMTDEDMPHVLRREAGLAKIDNHVVESRFRAGIEEGDPVVGFKRSRGDYARPSELMGVEDVNHSVNGYP